MAVERPEEVFSFLKDNFSCPLIVVLDINLLVKLLEKYYRRARK